MRNVNPCMRMLRLNRSNSHIHTCILDICCMYWITSQRARSKRTIKSWTHAKIHVYLMRAFAQLDWLLFVRLNNNTAFNAAGKVCKRASSCSTKNITFSVRHFGRPLHYMNVPISCIYWKHKALLLSLSLFVLASIFSRGNASNKPPTLDSISKAQQHHQFTFCHYTKRTQSAVCDAMRCVYTFIASHTHKATEPPTTTEDCAKHMYISNICAGMAHRLAMAQAPADRK